MKCLFFYFMYFCILLCAILLDMESRLISLFVEESKSIICRQIAITIMKM